MRFFIPRFLRTKKFLIVAAAIAAIAIAGGAYAYYSANGTGTGSATAGSASAIQLSGNGVGGLYPGGADVPVTISITNPGSGNQYVGTISGSVENANSGACLGSWFVVDPVSFDQEVPAGQTTTANTHIRMTDADTNQNACQGQTLTIDWSSN